MAAGGAAAGGRGRGPGANKGANKGGNKGGKVHTSEKERRALRAGWRRTDHWNSLAGIHDWYGVEKVRVFDIPNGSIDVVLWKITVLKLSDNGRR
jgi:hypothetical protein